MSSITKSEAPAQAAGYLFQLRYALLRGIELIKEDPTGWIGIEKIDDFYTSASGSGVVGQVKHASNSTQTFTDYSASVWKTLGNWCRLINDGVIKLEDTKFFLCTNAALEEGSALDILSASPSDENAAVALSSLRLAATASENAATLTDRQLFLNLPPLLQGGLVRSMRVVHATGLSGMTEDLRKALHFSCEATQLSNFVAELEGWWIARISPNLAWGRVL